METISDYCKAERAESLRFIAVGGMALAASAWCVLVLGKPFFNGMAITLSVVAALQWRVGVTVCRRTLADAARVQQMVRAARARLKTDEVKRMLVVMHNFTLYLTLEVMLLLASVVVLTLATQAGAWRGAATGLAAQAVFTMALDLAATRRGAAYLDWLVAMY
jgi:hypothetical protein